MTKKRLMRRATRKEQEKISRDCWNLDISFLDWILPRLKTYLKESIVNLDYHKFNHRGNEFTQREMIEKMISILEENLGRDAWDERYRDDINEFLEMFKEVFFALWW